MIRLVRELGRTCDGCRATGAVTLYALEAGGQTFRLCAVCEGLCAHGRSQLVSQGLDAITLYKPIPWGQP